MMLEDSTSKIGAFLAAESTELLGACVCEAGAPSYRVSRATANMVPKYVTK